MQLAARLRELRERAGLTQQQLADRVKVTRDAVARWEAGRREPSLSNALAIVKALGVDCTALQESPSQHQDPPKKGRPRKADAPAMAGQEAKAEAARKSRKKKGGEA